jgi:hypothetical protein
MIINENNMKREEKFHSFSLFTKKAMTRIILLLLVYVLKINTDYQLNEWKVAMM